MAYTPTTWIQLVTTLGPTNLNKLESGLQVAASVADAAIPKPGGPADRDVLFWDSATSSWKTGKLTAAMVAAGAAILKSQLAALAISDSDVAVGAGIQYAKLILASSIKNSDLIPAGGTLADMPPGRMLTYNEVTGSVTISATTEATSNAIVTASAFTFDGTTPVVIECYLPDGSNAGGGTLNLVLFEDGNPIGVLAGSSEGGTAVIGLLRRRFIPTAGSHTYSVRGFRATANWTINVGAGGAGARVPGFIKITKE